LGLPRRDPTTLSLLFPHRPSTRMRRFQPKRGILSRVMQFSQGEGTRRHR